MPTPTNRYMNIGATSFTPAGGTAVPITGIKSIGYDEGVNVVKESADGDMFSTVSVNDHNEPKITLETLDAFVLYAQLAGQKGTLLTTVLDAYNKATVGGGGKTITFTNCQVEGRSEQHKHRQFSTQSLTFGGISVDGVTHPIAIAAL